MIFGGLFWLVERMQMDKIESPIGHLAPAMTKALILTHDAAEAFQALQILDGAFDVIRACNTPAALESQIAVQRPDLLIVYGLQGCEGLPSQALGYLTDKDIPVILMWQGLQSVTGEESQRTVRVVPPLNRLNAINAIHELGLSQIVNQSYLPSSVK